MSPSGREPPRRREDAEVKPSLLGSQERRRVLKSKGEGCEAEHMTRTFSNLRVGCPLKFCGATGCAFLLLYCCVKGLLNTRAREWKQNEWLDDVNREGIMVESAMYTFRLIDKPRRKGFG